MPTDDISKVIELLEDEDRRLDQINGGKGSLANAMAKELYGDENQIFVRYFKLFELKKNRLNFSSFWGKIYSNSVVSFIGK